MHVCCHGIQRLRPPDSDMFSEKFSQYGFFCKPVSPCRSHPVKTAHHSLFPDAIKPMMIRNIIAHTIIRVKLNTAVRVGAVAWQKSGNHHS